MSRWHMLHGLHQMSLEISVHSASSLQHCVALLADSLGPTLQSLQLQLKYDSSSLAFMLMLLLVLRFLICFNAVLA